MKFSRVLLIAFLCHTASAARAAEAEREPDHISEILSLKGDWDESAIEAEYQAVVTEKGPTLARNIAQERLCEAVMLGKKEAITFFARKTGKNREELLLTTTKMGLGVNCMLLCEERTDIDRMAADGSRALSWAAYHLDTDLARALIRAGARVAIKGNQDTRKRGEKLELGEKIFPYDLAERRIRETNANPADYRELLALLMPPVAADFLDRLRAHYRQSPLALHNSSLTTVLGNELMNAVLTQRAAIAIEACATCSEEVAVAIAENARECCLSREQEIAFLKEVISGLEPLLISRPAVASTIAFLDGKLKDALFDELAAEFSAAIRDEDADLIEELYESLSLTLTRGEQLRAAAQAIHSSRKPSQEICECLSRLHPTLANHATHRWKKPTPRIREAGMEEAETDLYAAVKTGNQTEIDRLIPLTGKTRDVLFATAASKNLGAHCLLIADADTDLDHIPCYGECSDGYHYRALMWAAIYLDTAFAKALIARGAMLVLGDYLEQEPPLAIALRRLAEAKEAGEAPDTDIIEALTPSALFTPLADLIAGDVKEAAAAPVDVIGRSPVKQRAVTVAAAISNLSGKASTTVYKSAAASAKPSGYRLTQWSPRSNELHVALKSLFARLESKTEAQEPLIAEILGMMEMDDKTDAEKTAIKSAFWLFRHEMRHKLRRLAITNLAGIEAFIQDIEAESAEAYRLRQAALKA